MNCNLPLVSVVVITYNSSKYVIETLDSIYNQTYKNIELIITDDASNDDTIKICNDWVSKNNSRFVRVEIIENKINTGVAANCNRGYNLAEGLWIKGIAGDDILYADCIESYVNYVLKNQHIEICFSKAQCFSISENGELIYGRVIPTTNNQKIYNKNAIEQLKVLLKGNIVVTPTMFVKKEVFVKHPFKEIYKYMEDIPFLIDITKSKIQLHFLDKITVKYRFSSVSLSQTKSNFFPSRMFETKIIYFFNEKKNIMEEYVPDAVKKEKKILLLWSISEYCFQNNASSMFYRLIYRILDKIL